MLSGFDNYDQIRRDKNLSKVRAGGGAGAGRAGGWVEGPDG